MKRVVAGVVCLLVASPVVAGAQERANSLRDGAWALRFSFDTSFSGGEVALKYHLAPKNTLRVGLSLSGRTNDEEGTDSDGPILYQTDEAQLDVEVLFLHYPRPLASTNIYFGAGPFVEFDERTYLRADEDFQESREDELTEVGVVAVIGAEWFASQALSLHVEYRMSAGHTSGERMTRYSSSFQPTEIAEADVDGWEVEAGRTVFFGLGMYF